MGDLTSFKIFFFNDWWFCMKVLELKWCYPAINHVNKSEPSWRTIFSWIKFFWNGNTNDLTIEKWAKLETFFRWIQFFWNGTTNDLQIQVHVHVYMYITGKKLKEIIKSCVKVHIVFAFYDCFCNCFLILIVKYCMNILPGCMLLAFI